MNKQYQAHLALLTANLIYSASYTIAKEVMPLHVGPSAFVCIRVFGACLLYWLYALFFIKEKVETKHIFHFALLAVVGVCANQLLFLKGLNITTPINAAIIMITSPIVVVIITILAAKEKFNYKNITGVILGFAGATALLTLKGDLSFGSETLRGDVYVLINAVSWSIYLIYVKPYMAKYNTVSILKWVFLFGLILVTPFGWNELTVIKISEFTPYVWFCIAFIVIATTFFAYLLNTFALKELSSSVVGAYIYLQPILAMAIALIAQKDEVNLVKIISTILIFAGVYLASKK